MHSNLEAHVAIAASNTAMVQARKKDRLQVKPSQLPYHMTSTPLRGTYWTFNGLLTKQLTPDEAIPSFTKVRTVKTGHPVQEHCNTH
jgi:hypothetical protein